MGDTKMVKKNVFLSWVAEVDALAEQKAFDEAKRKELQRAEESKRKMIMAMAAGDTKMVKNHVFLSWVAEVDALAEQKATDEAKRKELQRAEESKRKTIMAMAAGDTKMVKKHVFL